MRKERTQTLSMQVPRDEPRKEEDIPYIALLGTASARGEDQIFVRSDPGSSGATLFPPSPGYGATSREQPLYWAGRWSPLGSELRLAWTRRSDEGRSDRNGDE